MTNRPDWSAVYKGCVHVPDRDQELIAVTRETLRLARSAIARSQYEDAYHNYSAAWQEIESALMDGDTIVHYPSLSEQFRTDPITKDAFSK